MSLEIIDELDLEIADETNAICYCLSKEDAQKLVVT